MGEYLGAMRAELAMVAGGMELTGPADWLLDTVYLGGGTPSRLGGDLPRLLDSIREVATVAPGAEITVEANPEDVTPASAAAWRRAGANRLSLGSQSFDPAVLAWMHRAHSVPQIGDAFRTAREAGFDNISVDLIFALPRTLERDWGRDLEHALALEPEHVSLYGLTVEPRTPLSRWRDRGEVSEAGDDAYADEFLLANRSLASAGFEHYEVSNFGLRGRRSRHNSAYWSGAAYIGVGPSAHSFDGARRWWNVAPYSEWMRLASSGRSAIADLEVLDEENISNEKVYLGLRTNTGIHLESGESAEVQPWIDRGWAVMSNDSLRLTPSGWLLLDELAASLTLIRSRSYV